MPTKQRPRANYRNLPYGAGGCHPRGDGWEARWQEGGQRKSKQFATQDEGNEFLYKKWQERRSGTYRPPSDLTVQDVLDAWLDRHRDVWAASTYQLNESYVRNYLVGEFGAGLARELAIDRVQFWVDGLRRKGTGAPAIHAAVRVLGQAFRDAVKLRQIASDPTTGVTLPKIRKKPRVIWSAADVAKIDTHLATDARWLAVYRLALTTGVRPGELMALRWDDINLEAGTMLVARTLTRGVTGTLVVGETTKTGQSRAVALPPATVAALRRWRTEQAELRRTAKRWDIRNFVVTGDAGTHLFPSTWQRAHNEIIAAAGVRRIPLHSLRHTFATLALEQNIHPRIVQEILGHKSIQMTLDLYSHVSISLQEAASAALSVHLFGDARLQNDGL